VRFEVKYFLGVVCLVWSLLSQCAVAHPAVGRKLDSLFTAYTDSGFSGAVLVAEKGAVSLQRGYGFANRQNNTPNTSATLFNIASLGKPFTAYAILLLEKEGKLRTSDHVSQFIGPFDDARDSVTIHHLLLHTSGVVKDGATLDYSTREGFIRSVKISPPDFVPDSNYRYSNAGYSILAAIIEIVAGEPFEQFLLKKVFVPAGMHHTGYPWESRLSKELIATGYDKNGNAVAPQENVWAARGPGNLVSSVEDLYAWVQALGSDDFLPGDMKDKFFRDYLPGKETYSWHKDTTSRKSRFYHKGGGRADFECHLMWYPDDDVLIIFCINNDTNLRGRLFGKIKSLIN